MNGGSIWWEQIGSSRRLLQEIKKDMENEQSFILHIPSKMPWKNYFYTMVDLQKASFSGERQLQRLEWHAKGDPGAFIMDRLCSREVQADYFPGQTYAEYLGSKDDILLCDYYVWVTGIDTKEDLEKWSSFVSQYIDQSAKNAKRAIFILEYSGASSNASSLKVITYSIAAMDCRVFCLEVASALENTALAEYQAELALCIGDSDPELSFALLEMGEEFIKDPVTSTFSVALQKRRSDYAQFEGITQGKINSSVWRANIALLFPIVEQYRFLIISKYEDTLRNYLPITNSNGDKVTEPYDIEIGMLAYLAGVHGQLFGKQDYENVRLCKDVRNKLAHNSTVSLPNVAAVMKLNLF